MGPQRDCLSQLAQGPLWLDDHSNVFPPLSFLTGLLGVLTLLKRKHWW